MALVRNKPFCGSKFDDVGRSMGQCKSAGGGYEYDKAAAKTIPIPEFHPAESPPTISKAMAGFGLAGF